MIKKTLYIEDTACYNTLVLLSRCSEEGHSGPILVSGGCAGSHGDKPVEREETL